MRRDVFKARLHAYACNTQAYIPTTRVSFKRDSHALIDFERVSTLVRLRLRALHRRGRVPMGFYPFPNGVRVKQLGPSQEHSECCLVPVANVMHTVDKRITKEPKEPM